MGLHRSAALFLAVGAAALASLGVPGLAAADTGDDAQDAPAQQPEVVSVTYYDRSGRVLERIDPRQRVTPDNNCMSLPSASGAVRPACGSPPPSGCSEVEARHGFDKWFGSVWLYHRVYWCWSNWVVSTATFRRHWRVIGAGICSAGEPVSWHSGGGIGGSYISYRSQVDASCVSGWVHVTIWMDIGYGARGNYWAIAWSDH